MNYKTIIISFFCLLSSFFQGNSQAENSVIIDSSEINIKEFSTNIKEKYTSENFNYNESVVESQNYLLRAIKWFFEKLGAIFGIEVDPEFFKLVETLIYIVLIIIATYIIIRLFAGSKATSFFNKKSKELAPLKYEEKHIEEINLEELIKQALTFSDYRLAIRYMYLKVLKEMSLNNLIDWHYDKTNLDYKKELNSSIIEQHFGNASHLYEHIWYGEFMLDESGYKNAIKEFDLLTKAIKQHG